MRNFHLLLLALAFAAPLTGSAEENKQAGDVIFKEPKAGTAQQLILGVTEAVLGQRLLGRAGAPLFGAYPRTQSAAEEIARAEQRVAALNKWNGTLKSKAFQAVKAFGGATLIADAAGRIYVWNILDANPRFSPALSLLSAKTGIDLHNLMPLTVISFDDPTTGFKGSFTIDSRASEAENKAAMAQVESSTKGVGAIGVSGVELLTAIALINSHPSYAVAQAEHALKVATMEHNLYANSIKDTSARMAQAQKVLSEARATQLQLANQAGRFGKAVRFVRVVGTSALIVDAFGRVIVWAASDATPKFSPVATVMLNTASKGTEVTSEFLSNVFDDGIKPPSGNRFLEKHDEGTSER